ncbi:MAG: ACT domain-containing protein [Chloroflexota bacterium]|nr:ACT domain-containing protein [Chloroflexota bacterium]PLS78654.1 MAG: ACT domain-containing protein [Chloroflexota bacterium]
MAHQLPPPLLSLAILPQRFAICRLEPQAPVPPWCWTDGLCAVTRTQHELSIVCLEVAVPAAVQSERGWRALQVDGPLDFGLTGVLAALAVPLAQAHISIFALSTFDTDYVLVRETQLERAVRALREAGHTLR